jgi:hypothetical protein
MELIMKKKKDTFIVFLPVYIFITVLTVVSVSMYILMMTVGRNDSVTTGVIIIGVLMFLIFPLGLWIWAFLYLLPQVKISEKGIDRKLLWMKKSVSWKEVKEITMIHTPTQGWLFFSESEIVIKGSGFWEISKYRLKKANIFIASNDQILEVVNTYAPEELLPIKHK